MTVPLLFQGLFDDAAVFPPGDLPLPEAVPAHLAHRAAWYADAVGPFLCGAGRLGELALLAVPGLQVGLVLGHLPSGVAGSIELPHGPGLLNDLDLLVGTPYRAKYRTGGLVAGAFPSLEELAVFLAGCAERGLPYKCTAGLHNAVRHTDPVTGFEHHGFLNVLLAAATPDRAAEVLAERSGAVLASAARDLTDSQIGSTRTSFTAFGTCSVTEPLADLAGLGLLPPLENR